MTKHRVQGNTLANRIPAPSRARLGTGGTIALSLALIAVVLAFLLIAFAPKADATEHRPTPVSTSATGPQTTPHVKVWVCHHYTVLIHVDKHSAAFKGHLKHRAERGWDKIEGLDGTAAQIIAGCKPIPTDHPPTCQHCTPTTPPTSSTTTEPTTPPTSTTTTEPTTPPVTITTQPTTPSSTTTTAVVAPPKSRPVAPKPVAVVKHPKPVTQPPAMLAFTGPITPEALYAGIALTLAGGGAYMLRRRTSQH